MSLASSGITVSVVKSALGVNNNNVGGLCASEKINPWSKWKPISANATTLTLDILKSNNYGITILSAKTADSLLTAVNNNNKLGYKYNKPTGVATSPYRLGDFRNYNHSADNPMYSHFNDGDSRNISGVSTSYTEDIEGLEVNEPASPDDSDYLTKTHLYPTTDGEVKLQKGVLITNGTYTYWSVGNIPWGNTYWQRFKGSTCSTLEFLTNLPSGRTSVTHTANDADRFYAIPEPLHSITVKNVAPAGSQKVWIQYENIAYSDYSFTAVTYDFYLSSMGDVYTGGTLTNLMVGLSSDAKGVNIIAQARLETSSITLGTDDVTRNYTGTIRNNNGTFPVYFCVWFNSALQFVTQPMMEADDRE